MSANQHFPAWNTYLHTSWDKWRLGPRLRLQGLHPREGTGVDWCEDNLRKLLWNSWESPGKSLGWQEIIVIETLVCSQAAGHCLCECQRQRARQNCSLWPQEGTCEGMSGRSGTSHKGSLWSQRRIASRLATAKACVSVRGGGQESTVVTLEVAAATKLWQVQATAHTFLGAYAASLSQGTWDREPIALGECTSHLRLQQLSSGLSPCKYSPQMPTVSAVPSASPAQLSKWVLISPYFHPVLSGQGADSRGRAKSKAEHQGKGIHSCNHTYGRLNLPN